MAETQASESAKLAFAKAGYETDALLSQYLSLHFGPLEIAFADFSNESGILASGLDFPKKCGEFVNDWQAKTGATAGRALDLGCAVGRSTFEMARVYGEVIGIDLSQRFIDAANEMKDAKQIPYQLRVEGDITEPAVARLEDDIDTSRVQFMQVRAAVAVMPVSWRWSLDLSGRACCIELNAGTRLLNGCSSACAWLPLQRQPAAMTHMPKCERR